MANLKLPAIKIDQFNEESKAVYLTKITAKQLVEDDMRFDVRYYDRIELPQGGYKDVGYQRRPDEKKIDKITTYILEERKGKPEFPTSIVACTENILDFEKSSNGIGMLVIKPTLYIVDGWHRFTAWKRLIKGEGNKGRFSDLEEYEMPLVILSGFKEIDEVLTFFIVNSRQTKVKTDLAHRHYIKLASDVKTKDVIKPKELWIVRANKVANILNENTEGPWKKLMLNANETRENSRIKPITVSAFATSLKPLYDHDYEGIFQETKAGGIEVDAKILNNFWKIVSKVWPNPFKDPKRFTLLKTVGVYPIHILIAEILEKNPNNEIAALDEFEKILTNANRRFGSSFWFVAKELSNDQRIKGKYAGAYSSAQGHKHIVQILNDPDLY